MEVASLMTSEPEQVEETIPPVIDPVLLGLVHQSAIQQQATPATVEMEPTPEEGGDQPEPKTVLSLVPLAASSHQLLTWWRSGRLVRQHSLLN